MDIKQIAYGVANEMFLEGKLINHEPSVFLRRCLEKLADQDVEATAWRYWKDKFACWEYSDEPLEFPAVPAGTAMYPLFTEAQLIAAQQRTADICAKVFEQAINYQPDADKNLICRAEKAIAAMRSGEWRNHYD